MTTKETKSQETFIEKVSNSVFSVLSTAIGGFKDSKTNLDNNHKYAHFKLEEFRQDGCYEKCMIDINRFQRQQSVNVKEQERIDECLSNFKEYWRLVDFYSATYGLSKTENEQFSSERIKYKNVIDKFDKEN